MSKKKEREGRDWPTPSAFGRAAVRRWDGDFAGVLRVASVRMRHRRVRWWWWWWIARHTHGDATHVSDSSFSRPHGTLVFQSPRKSAVLLCATLCVRYLQHAVSTRSARGQHAVSTRSAPRFVSATCAHDCAERFAQAVRFGSRHARAAWCGVQQTDWPLSPPTQAHPREAMVGRQHKRALAAGAVAHGMLLDRPNPK